MNQARIDNVAVDSLAEAMKAKLAYKRSVRGGRYHGWEDMDELALWEELVLHVFRANKDPIDIANYCAMIHANRMKEMP